MKVAVLGTGFGAYHAELYSKNEDIAEVVVWGRNQKKLEELKNNFGVHVTTDMAEIYDNPEIELIDICLPSILHKEYAIKALESGKHVFIETPVAYSVEDAKDIQMAAIENNRLAMVDLFIRFDYPYQYLKGVVDAAKYGKLRSFKITRETPPWWGNLGKGKLVTDLMMHDIDYTSWILGQTDNISAVMSFPDEGRGITNINLQYDNAAANIWGSSMMPATHPFTVGYEAVFDKAAVRYYEDGYRDGRLDTKLVVFTEDAEKEVELKQQNSYDEAIKCVIECIKNRKHGEIDISMAVKSLAMALAVI